MNKLGSYLFFLSSIFLSGSLAQAESVPEIPLTQVLHGFMSHQDGTVLGEVLLSDEKNDEKHVRIKTYRFTSQIWPVTTTADVPTTEWKHRLTLYIPDDLNQDTALLHVGGGYNWDKDGKENFQESREKLDFVGIAQKNRAIVVHLQDVPNQFLSVGGRFQKEDQILAYTYMQVMKDPLKNAYLAGHLPMVKAILKGMDAVQSILLKEEIGIKGFVLSGASKRGWAVWLAVLEDERIQAIIPIVIDILNTQKSISHICYTYQDGCPFALRDYAEAGVTSRLETEEFADLMKIEDPFSYLGPGYAPRYRVRMAKPKLIISASGDDFFTPDSSWWYFQALPGLQNHIRYLPNSMHYFAGNPISDSTKSLESINQSVLSYFGFILHQKTLPKLSWSFSQDQIHLLSSHKPKKAVLWSAQNEESRDFRFINKHTTWHLLKKRIRLFFSMEVCDTCYVAQEVPLTCEGASCEIITQSPAIKKGWQASFLELHYDIDGTDFVLSTEVHIREAAHPSSHGAVKELPGGH
ncbi:MAG: hypothetical protein KA436_00225 [Oligoflexales bacterium]|nr:hypothetical protein [Oligoflexales bacterium]